MVGHTTMSCDEFLDRAAAAVLDSVDAEEARLVEEHAATCPDCAVHFQDFREVAAVLGAAVPQVDPTEGLRASVLEAARRTPVTLSADARRSWPRTRARFRLSPAWLVAAASLVFSVVALIRVIAMQGQIVALQSDALTARERAARYDHVAEVLASDQLAIRPLQPTVQAMPYRGMVYMDPLSGTGMVMCHDMPPLEQGHAYQVWFVRGNEKVSGGLIWPDREGNGYTLIQVPKDLQSFDSVGVTDEPGNGSAWPTTPRVIGTPLYDSAQ
jgi:anti-sigma-K factor RskA/putative zinc finger protein